MPNKERWKLLKKCRNKKMNNSMKHPGWHKKFICSSQVYELYIQRNKMIYDQDYRNGF